VTTALYRCDHAGSDADGAELERVTVTYLAAELRQGRRITALLVHGR